MSNLKLNKYKQEIANLYDQRSETYDDNNRLEQICHRLLEYAQVRRGQTVLDIGTGTGHLALAAAKIVEDSGQVIGVDISPRMLEKAQRKAKALAINNVYFQLLDAEFLAYPTNHFDHILCANTFPWIEHKEKTLSLWCNFLKRGGRIGVHTPSDTAYIGQLLLRKVLGKYGVSLAPSNRIGSIEQCVNLFNSAGFEAIKIKTENHGSYTTLEKEKDAWSGTMLNSSSIYLKMHDNELSKLSLSTLAQAKREFDQELEARETELGIWNEVTTWYVFADKP